MHKLQCINHIGETTFEVLDKTFLSPSFFFSVNIYLFPYATLQLRCDLLQPVPLLSSEEQAEWYCLFPSSATIKTVQQPQSQTQESFDSSN